MHTIAMHLGSGEPLRLLARTVWSSTDRHAVAFVALDDVDRLAIAEHIDQFLARVA